MKATTLQHGWRVGEWLIAPSLCRIERAGVVQAVEPKVMDLLVLLSSRPGEIWTHDELMAALWPGVLVGDDTLARCVSKLRRALGDDARTPTYVETVSKRGYRIIAPVDGLSPAPEATRSSRKSRLWLVAAGVAIVAMAGTGLWRISSDTGREPSSAPLIARAKDSYFQFTRADNEMAIDLYERVLAVEPDNAEALSGLATALVQQVIRWPNAPGEADYSGTTLEEALSSGRTETPGARMRLGRARVLAERATQQSPTDSYAHQALGLTLAAMREYDAARVAHERAVSLNPDAWGALINLGDLEDIEGRRRNALPYYERAYAAMARAYPTEPQRIRPWQGALGVLIADRHRDAGNTTAAEAWYRRVLLIAPLHPGATSRLAELLAARGEPRAALRLCMNLVERTGPNPACERIIAGSGSVAPP